MQSQREVILVGRRYDTGLPARVLCRGGRVIDVAPLSTTDSALPWIAPGLVDLQINGFRGQEFSSADLTPERVASIVNAQLADGVTQLYPTLTTERFEVLAAGVRAIAHACEEIRVVSEMVGGIHLEGPYLSAEDGPRGAHPKAHCRAPDWEEFQRLQEFASGRIRILTLSPEYAEAPNFIARAVRAGVTVALGHMNASGEQIRAAVDAGARFSTHLGNGAHPQLRRHPNYIWDQLAEDRLGASLIVDGHHLPPEVVKVFVRAKRPEHCVLVSDLSGLAGLPPGRYHSSGCELEILPEGKLVIAGQRPLLAGAALPLRVGIENVMRFAGVDLATAVRMASAQPAALVGGRCGGLEPGDRADLVLFDYDGAGSLLRIIATVRGGEVVAGQLPAKSV